MSRQIAGSSDVGVDETSPLPLIVASNWNFSLQYYEINGDIFYAILDWIAGIAQVTTEKASKLWNDQRHQTSVSTRSLKYLATDGKEYKRPFTNDEGLYKIAAYMRATKTRPALREIKELLAKAGVFADLARRDSEQAEIALSQKRREKYIREGKTPEWIATREFGIVTRKQLMAIVYHLLGTHEHMATITNDTYRGIFGMTAQELRVHIGIPQQSVLRDYFGTMALVYTQAAEEAARIQLDKYDDNEYVAPEDIRAIVSALSRLVGKQAREMSRMLGIDVVTGRPLLESQLTRDDFMSALAKASKPHDT